MTTLETLRVLLRLPNLVDVQRLRTPIGTAWLLSERVPCARHGEHVTSRSYSSGTFRKPARLARWLHRYGEPKVLVTDEDARRLVRALHEFCDARES